MHKSTRDNKWQYWQNELLEILGITQEQFAKGTITNTPWFLVPQQNELSKDRVLDLFLTIREYLLGPTLEKPIRYAIERIRKLKPAESLPLLYAMRHVARDQGSIGRYWPIFHSEILGKHLTLDDVRVRLAPELERVWTQLLIHTRGALYYPREGQRFIKWPLAHAGILGADEEVLRAFGRQLVSVYGDKLLDGPIGAEDLDEFLYLFLEWFQGLGTQFRTSQLGQLLHRQDGSNVTVSELAQQWIGEHWEEILAKEERNTPVSVPTLLRPSLQYDSTQQLIFIALRETRWAGSVEVVFLWDKEYPGRTRYRRDEDETICLPFKIPLLESTWTPQGKLLVESERHPVRVPHPPAGHSLVFRSDNGFLVRQWHLGEEYYVLMPNQKFDNAAADVLFEEWVSLGSPEGEWNDYTLFWVRVKDPLRQNTTTGHPTILTSILVQFARVADSLNLPGFGHLLSTRLYLFGGTRLASLYKEETYDINLPPWLEIRGVWDENLPLALVKQNENDSSFSKYSVIELPPLHFREAHLVDIWDNINAPPGLYRLEINSKSYTSFRLIDPSTHVASSRFEISLKIEDESGISRNTGLTLRDLDRGTMVVCAWPQAELSLTIRYRSQAHTIPLFIDKNGLWRKRWRDLGFERISEGKADITLSWRGIIRSHLTFASAPFVAEGDLTWCWIEKKELEVSARISNGAENYPARLLVIGTYPWKGQLWGATKRVDEASHLRVRIPAQQEEARWLIILSDDLMEGEQHIWAVEPLRTNSSLGYYPMDRIRGGEWDVWRDTVRQLKIFSLPQGLHKLLSLSNIGVFLDEYAELQSLKAQWITVTHPDILDNLAKWKPFGFHPPTVLLHSRETVADISVSELIPPFLCADSLDKLLNILGGEEVPIACVAPNWSVGEIDSTLCAIQKGQKIEFEVQIAMNEYIYSCSKCGLAIPSNLFSKHVPPNKGECADRMGEAFSSYPPGSQMPVHLALLIDPQMLFSCITGFLMQLVSEQGESIIPPNADHWLDQLDTVYNDQQGQEAHLWLADLVNTAHTLWNVIYRDEKPDLVELGRRVDRYKAGLDILYKWLSDEFHNATT